MTGAILTTFPFDAEFYENALINVMSRKNIGGKNAVLLDSAKYDETFNTDEGPTVSAAGIDYHLAPVDVPGRRVFHPKVFFFAGERRVYVFIGSANLTQKGLTDNAELVSQFSYEKNREDNDSRHLPVLRAVKEFLADLFESEYAASIGEFTNEVAVQDILGACAWLDDVEADTDPSSVQFLHNLDLSIFAQVIDEIGDERVEEVSLVAPFFGESTRVLERFSELEDASIQLYLQQDTARIPVDDLEKWLEENENATLTVFEHPRFVHGKLAVIKTAERSYCLTGSPNPSYQGMLAAAGDGGNIETAVLRRAADRDHFDYLLDQVLVGNEVGASVADFRPHPEPLVEDQPTAVETPEIHLRDAVYSTETTYAGGLFSLVIEDVEVGEKTDGTVQITSRSGGTISLSLQDASMEQQDDGSGFVELAFEITDDEYQSILSTLCTATVTWNGRASNRRWVMHKSPQEEEIVREEIESGATGNVPDMVPDLLLGDETTRSEVLRLLGQIVDGMQEVSPDGDGGGGHTRRTLPPDFQVTSSPSTADPDKLLHEIYEAWYRQMVSLVYSDDEVDSETVVQDFTQLLSALHRTSAHILFAHHNADSLGYDPSTNYASVPRHYLGDLYSGNDAVVRQFCSRLAEQENRDSNAVYAAIQEYVLPQIIFCSLVVNREEDEVHRFYDRSLEESASYCFESFSLSPTVLTDQSINQTVTDVRGFAEETFSRFDRNRLTDQYYDSGDVEDFVLKFYGRLLALSGPRGVRNYFDRLRNQIEAESRDIEEIRHRQYKVSAYFTKEASDLFGSEAQERISQHLSGIADDLEYRHPKYRAMFENALLCVDE